MSHVNVGNVCTTVTYFAFPVCREMKMNRIFNWRTMRISVNFIWDKICRSIPYIGEVRRQKTSRNCYNILAKISANTTCIISCIDIYLRKNVITISTSFLSPYFPYVKNRSTDFATCHIRRKAPYNPVSTEKFSLILNLPLHIHFSHHFESNFQHDNSKL